MSTNDSTERTVSERRREQNRRAQRKFRERHGKRAYERRPPTPASSSCSTTGADFSNSNSRAGSISDSIAPADLTSTKPSHGMTFSPSADPLCELVNFHDNDCVTSPDVNADIFALINTPPQEPPQDLFNPFGDLPDDLTPGPQCSPADVPYIPIHMAVRQGSAKIVDLLLRHGVECNDPDDAGLSPLMHASIGGRVDIVNMLLDSGAAISCSDGHQQSPLHWAVLHRCHPLLKSLLKHCRGNTDIVNAFDRDGKTPLHVAIETKFDLAVEELLHAGANARCPVRRTQSRS